MNFRLFNTLIGCAVFVLAFKLIWVQQNPEAPNLHEHLELKKSHPSAESKLEAITPQHTPEITATKEFSHQKNTNTAQSWPIPVIQSLNTLHPDYDTAINLITRAVAFETFAALSTDQTDRLIRYAQVVNSGSSEHIAHLCWGRSTQREVVKAFESVRTLAISEGDELREPARVFQGDGRWTFTATDGNTGSEGTPVTLTWSFVPDGTIIDNDEGQTLPNNLIATLNTTYGTSPSPNDYTQAPWFGIFESAFAGWAAITGNIYVYEPNDDGSSFPVSGSSNGQSGSLGVRGDIRIAGVRIDGNSGTLAFNYFPNGGDMVIDTDDSSNFTNDPGTIALFENTISHEHGHGLGLSHVCPVNETKLMEPFVSDLFEGPQLDEVLTAHDIYGDSLERQGSNKNNNTIATARDLGSLNTGFNANDISISDTGDVDIYRFEINATRQLNVSVTPTAAAAYLEGEQNINGCTAGTAFDPEPRQDLIIRVLASDGVTVLGTSNTAAIGQAETLNNIQLLQTGQSYYVEISGGGENSGDANNAQLYSLNIELVDPSAVQIKDFKITNETCTPSNGSPDPDELITGTVTVENIGTNAATNIVVTLSGSNDLSIQGSATQNIGTLAAGNTIDVSYTFSLAGDCADLESITLRADSTTGFVELNQDFTLGSIGSVSVEDFDSTTIGLLPTDYSQISDNASANWETSDSSADSVPNSAFSPGLASVNSAYLISPNLTGINADSELRFDHNYFMEGAFDGGVLEISLNNGSWVEWINAGGSFTQNGYDTSISSGFSSPIASQDAWTGNSNGFIQTIAIFPPSAYGQSVRVRWHQANDNSQVEDGWWIDNIELIGSICCESTIPTLSVTAPNPTVAEFTPSTTADFIITADMDMDSNLSVAYTLSGDAIADTDFIALAGSATILSGQDMATIPVTAITDNEVEGDETLTLTLSPSLNYGIGTATANITIKDLPFDEYRHTNFGSSTSNIADDEDFDFDGIANLIEYAFRLSPTAATTLPFSLLVENSGGQTLELTYYEDTEITDINYIVETSTTLAPSSWSTTGVTITNGTTTDGLLTRTASIPINNQPGFIRLRIERINP